MTRRPTTRTSVLSRLRGPVGLLRDTPIWVKLVFIMIVPTLATVVVGTNALLERVDTANNADRARTLAALSGEAGGLVHELQNERAAATMLFGAPSDATKKAYQEQFAATDAARKRYTQLRTGLAGLPDSFRVTLNRIDTQLSELPQMRDQVVSLKDVTETVTAFRYRVLITDLLGIRDFASQIAGDSALSLEMRAAAAISNAKEYLSLERVTVLRALNQGSMPPALRRDFIATMTGQEQALLTYAVVATPQERTLLDQTVSGPDLREAVKYEGEMKGISGDDLPDDIFTAKQWDDAMVGRANLMRTVEQRIDQQTVRDATALRDDMQRQVVLETVLLLVILAIAVLFAWLVAREMARSLRDLRHGALAVAQYGLPQAVARLRDPTLVGQAPPEQVALQIAEQMPVRSKDEFGQVTEAFNAVHLEAVRTAAEQAALRSSVATMFVNLARRSQILVDRLIGHLDRLERGEEDPDRLAELFQLDHLATRMRRNDENLLVLAGADSTRVQRQPAALIDVLRAAQSEVEHYTRVELGVVDRDIEIAAHAVNDLVHLIAELLDNATVFSPPDSAVVVEARRVGDRAVLYVEDHGIGMSAEQMAELNERLATPPMVDVAVSRMMGLVVVARLANRHGIKVELRPAPERGTIADVLLPTTVLTPRALAGRGSQAQGGLPARPSAPLALETGSASTGPTPVRPTAPAAGGPSGVHPPAQRGTGRLTSAGANSFASTTDSLDADRLISGSTGFIGGAGARNLPAWSDLTGAGTVNGANGSDPSAPGAPRTVQSEPLPQRRVHDHWGASENTPESDIRPVVPRQTRPAEPAAPQPPAEADTAATVPPGEAVPDQPQAPALPVPESLASALDMTTEMPKVHVEYTPDEAAGGAATGQPAATPQVPQAAPVAGGAPRYPDETMEMPIFRELESAWFRARPYSPAAGGNEPVTGDGVGADPAVRPSAATWSVPVEGATTNATSGAGAQVGETRGGAMAESSRSDDRARERGSAWQTSADAGWSAASAAADPQAGGVTGAGLPRRVPMAQLVPGGVEKAAATPNRRSPDAVRGLLSAYHRGVQRGRTQPKADQHPESRTTGSHTGKEQEA